MMRMVRMQKGMSALRTIPDFALLVQSCLLSVFLSNSALIWPGTVTQPPFDFIRLYVSYLPLAA